jgi:hypothetical protein
VRSRLNQGRRYLSDALAATAADAHPDNAALVRRRWQERSAAAEAMLRDRDAGGYFLVLHFGQQFTASAAPCSG